MNVSGSSVASLIAAMVISCLSVSCESTNDSEVRKWVLTWQDEFDGAEGQLPDTTRWGFDVGTDWGNAQLEYDTDRSENASLDGQGHLVITARQEAYMGSNYTSARINTRGLFETTYGRFEARMLLPWGQGMWPAFWLLGANFEAVGWPESGEIDIMEYRGQEPSRVHGSVHGPGYSGAATITNRYNLVRDRFDTGFHLFAVEWGTDYIRWYVDDVFFHEVTPTDLPGDWVFDHPFYIILNLAVGGHYVGPPSASTVFPQTMIIDWVRAYK